MKKQYTIDDIMQHCPQIWMLAMASKIWSIRVFESGSQVGALPIEGHLCFLIYTEMPHLLADNIQLHHGLHLLLGYPPHLIPVEAYTGVELDEFVMRSVSIYP